MTGRLLAALGPDALEMGWPDVVDLLDYWRSNPPANEVLGLIAMRFGAMAPPEPPSPSKRNGLPTREDLDALERGLGAA